MIKNPSTIEAEDINAFNQVSAKFQQAVDQYALKDYDDHLIVFYAKEHYYFVDRINNILYKKLDFSSDIWSAWKNYVKSVELHEVDGEHFAMFNRDYAGKLADLLQQHLNRSFPD
jgi:thioesterase domain-containing protein